MIIIKILKITSLRAKAKRDICQDNTCEGAAEEPVDFFQQYLAN